MAKGSIGLYNAAVHDQALNVMASSRSRPSHLASLYGRFHSRPGRPIAAPVVVVAFCTQN